MFATTSWTMVFEAARGQPRADNRALGQLIERYWQPLYFFARRQGLSAVDAEDATQSFLMELMSSSSLAAVDPAKGRFRTYLLTLWKRFLIDRARSENRLKRGGGLQETSLSCAEGERAWLAWSLSASPDVDPDQAYYEQWAANVVDSALRQLQAEYRKSRREQICQALTPFLTLPIQTDDYRRLSAQLGCSEGSIKVALHRLRQRFAWALRQQVLETLDDPKDLDAELEELIRHFQRTATSQPEA